MQITSSISAEKIREYLPDGFFRTIIVKETTESTNDDVKIISRGEAAAGVVVISNGQTRGRGRGGRSFYSPADSGVYLSVLLPVTAENLLKITPFAAVCVCKTIESLSNLRPQIKWVNDIFLRGKKVCGILCESLPQQNCAIVGVGINYSTTVYPEDIKGLAGPVFETDAPDKNAFIGKLLSYLTDTALFDRCIEEYRCRSCVAGKWIQFRESGVLHTAYAKGIDEHGGLVIFEEGSVRTLFSGEVSVVCMPE
ncbi:MAG: biotin--[acetyl-CoA-carboxylase] ligase [Methanocorpusculum sp.]|nr:biotin--[acetyl-CoA-carboxylase] ligase [Methanocorpusculum sp.]